MLSQVLLASNMAETIPFEFWIEQPPLGFCHVNLLTPELLKKSLER